MFLYFFFSFFFFFFLKIVLGLKCAAPTFLAFSGARGGLRARGQEGRRGNFAAILGRRGWVCGRRMAACEKTGMV